MADLSPRPGAPASSPTLAELHRLCREDYAKGQTERAAAHTEHVPLSATHLVEPTDLEPVGEAEDARRSVDRAFPAVAAFLNAERGEQR